MSEMFYKFGKALLNMTKTKNPLYTDKSEGIKIKMSI